MASKERAGRKALPIGLKFSIAFYFLAGLYNLTFPIIFDPYLVHLWLLGVFSLLAAINISLRRMVGLWLGIFTLPLAIVNAVATLNSLAKTVGLTRTLEATLFGSSLMAYIAGAILAAIFILDKRKELGGGRGFSQRV